jgi:hypothetical protein
MSGKFEIEEHRKKQNKIDVKIEDFRQGQCRAHGYLLVQPYCKRGFAIVRNAPFLPDRGFSARLKKLSGV